LNDIPFHHVSSGCIYQGDCFYKETDAPNFDESWYSFSKKIGEIMNLTDSRIYRLRIPFSHVPHQKNFISKIIKFDKLTNHYNSISNIEDFVRAVSFGIRENIPAGIYNITNPGKIKAREISEMLKEKKIVPSDKVWEILENPEDVKRIEKIPRSNCTLDSSKIINLGVPLQEIHESLNKTLDSWMKNGTIFW
jgi:dTDP-4-dehydrorhamnose reductase